MTKLNLMLTSAGDREEDGWALAHIACRPLIRSTRVNLNLKLESKNNEYSVRSNQQVERNLAITNETR